MSIDVKDAAGVTRTIQTIGDLLEIVATNEKLDELIEAIGEISPGGGSGGDASAANQLTLIEEIGALSTTLSGLLGDLKGYTDGLETLVTGSNTKLDTIHTDLGTTLSGLLSDLKGYTDGLEGLITTQNGYVDGLETLVGATNTALTTLHGYVDGLETALSTLNGKDFATQTTSAAILAKLIAAPATEAKQDAEIAAVNRIGTRAYGTAATRLGYSGTSAQSAAITGTEVLLHNCGTARCFIQAASNPTATANDIPLEAGEKFHLRITSGHKIAAIQDTVSGNLNIVPVV